MVSMARPFRWYEPATWNFRRLRAPGVSVPDLLVLPVEWWHHEFVPMNESAGVASMHGSHIDLTISTLSNFELS